MVGCGRNIGHARVEGVKLDSVGGQALKAEENMIDSYILGG